MSDADSSASGLLPNGEVPRGASIGRYLVTSRLGAGGMGVVYAAYDPELNRKVAIKLLRPSGSTAGDSEGRVRLLREAQSMAQLSHPNVIAVFDVGTAYDQVFVAMEFVDGGTLTDWLEKPRAQEEILEVFSQAGRGLAAAHAAGLIHRDFKPDNTLVGRDGRVRVMDFGLARSVVDQQGEAGVDSVAEAVASSLAAVVDPSHDGDTLRAGLKSGPMTPMTQTGALMGTPRYMSPEQFRGQKADGRSDQFSFCVALYEALCGIPPFTGDSIGERCFNVLQHNVVMPPPGRRPPAWLHRALLRGLEVDPADRHADMNALLQVLSPEARHKRKRRVLFVGFSLLAALAGVAVFGGLRVQRLRAAARCDDSQAQIDRVFGPQVRQRAQQALSKNGKAYAEEAWTHVAQNVDSYLAAWRAMRSASCQATYVSVKRRENRHLHDRRMRCLDSLLQEVSAFTAMLEKADSGISEHAAETSGAFTPVASCADNVALLALSPERPEVRERVDALNRELAEVRIIAKLARYEPAQARAQKAVATAQQIGYGPAVAQALQILASIEYDNADSSNAERDYFAMAAASMRSGDHRGTALAFVELSRIIGRHHKQFEQADRFSQLALAARSRASSSEAWIADFEVQRLWYSCQIDATRQEFSRAEKSCREALQKQQAAHHDESAQHLGILISLANVYKRQEKFAESFELYKQALQLGQRAYGEVHPNIAVDLQNIGGLFAAQGDLQTASQYYAKSLEIYKRVFGERHPRLFSVYAALTRSAYLQGNFDEAVRYAEEAQKLDGELGSATVYAVSSCLLGDALYRKGDFDAALLQHEKALERCDPRRCEAEWSYFQIARADDLRALRKTKLALPILEEAVRLLPPTADREVQARGKFALAQTLFDVEKRKGWERAEELATASLLLYKEAGRHTERQRAEINAWLQRNAPQ